MMKMPTVNSSGRVFPVAADIPKREVTIYEVVRSVLSVTLSVDSLPLATFWSLPPPTSAETEVKFLEAHCFLNGTDFNSKDELFTSVVSMRVCCFSCCKR